MSHSGGASAQPAEDEQMQQPASAETMEGDEGEAAAQQFSGRAGQGQLRPLSTADDHKFKRPAVPSNPVPILSPPKRGARGQHRDYSGLQNYQQQFVPMSEPGPSSSSSSSSSAIPPGQLPPIHQLSPAQVQQQMQMRAAQMQTPGQAQGQTMVGDAQAHLQGQGPTLRQIAQQQHRAGNVYAVRTLHPTNHSTLVATPQSGPPQQQQQQQQQQQSVGQVILGQRYYDSGRANLAAMQQPPNPHEAPPPGHRNVPYPLPDARTNPQPQLPPPPGLGRSLPAMPPNMAVGAMLRGGPGPMHPHPHPHAMGRGTIGQRGAPPPGGVQRVPPGAAPFVPYRTAPAIVYPPHFINEKNGMVMTKVVWNADPFYVPSILTNSEWVLREVLNAEVYESLPEQIKQYLRQFFPRNVSAKTPQDEREILKAAFTARTNQTAGNPMSRFFTKLHAGWYNPEKQSELVQLKDNSKVLYDHYIRFYNINLLKQLAVSRHILMEHHLSSGPNEEPARQPLDAIVAAKKRHFKKVKSRAAKRAKLMLADCRQRVGEFGFSSDEEPDQPISKALTSVTAKSTLYSMNLRDLDLHQPTQIDDLKKMLKIFKKLQDKDPQEPSLNISGIDLDEVFERAGIQAQSQKIKETMDSLEACLRDRTEEL